METVTELKNHERRLYEEYASLSFEDAWQQEREYSERFTAINEQIIEAMEAENV